MLLFRENVLGGTKWNAGGPLGVATGEEAWELRLVMKSENGRENRRFPGKLYFLTNLSGIKRFPANKLYFHNDLSVNMRLFPDKLI